MAIRTQTRQVAFALLSILLNTGCSTARGRFLLGAGLGGIAGGASAVALSPNSESRGMNALVFGLTGAVAGGLLGILTYDDSRVPRSEATLRSKEEALNASSLEHSFEVISETKLPAFVKQRYQSPVIEELTVPDTVSEDGSLHEPHKVYRIQRNAELYSGSNEQPRQAK